ncbi:fimbrial protein, partial [Escherichia coli]
MKDADGTKVGSVKVNASYAGVKVTSKYKKMNSLYAGHIGAIFYGGLPFNVAQAELQSGFAAAERTGLFGSLSKNELIQQVQTVRPDVTQISDAQYSNAEDMQYSNNDVVSA